MVPVVDAPPVDVWHWLIQLGQVVNCWGAEVENSSRLFSSWFENESSCGYGTSGRCAPRRCLALAMSVRACRTEERCYWESASDIGHAALFEWSISGYVGSRYWHYPCENFFLSVVICVCVVNVWPFGIHGDECVVLFKLLFQDWMWLTSNRGDVYMLKLEAMQTACNYLTV